jgi:hypothetical protein
VTGDLSRHSLPDAAGPDADGRRDPAAVVRFQQRVGDEWRHWTVVEADARGVPGARGPTCLVFTRDDCIRRVWDYPANWRTLDAAALAAVSWRV